jgi:hypothetical protein
VNKSIEKQNGPGALLLPFGLTFDDLYTRDGLVKLDEFFQASLQQTAPALAERLATARQEPPAPHTKSGSELIIELASYVEDFIG